MNNQIVLLVMLFCFTAGITAQTQSGIASVRPLEHEGIFTKSGLIFSHDSLVASHRNIPFGSLVKVTNLKNMNSVEVTINDRGPFIVGHIIDLTQTAGQQIGLSVNGLAEVKIDILKLERDFKINPSTMQSTDGDFTIKLGSFSDKANAVKFATALAKDHKIENVTVKNEAYDGKALYKVFVGRFLTRELAEQYLAQLPASIGSGYITTFKE